MRYDEKNDRIVLTADELVAFSFHRTAGDALLAYETRNFLLSLPHKRSSAPVSSLAYPFTREGQHFLLTVDVGESCLYFSEKSRKNEKNQKETAAFCEEVEASPTDTLPNLCLARATEEDPRHPSEELLRRARGELFLAAHAYFEGAEKVHENATPCVANREEGIVNTSPSQEESPTPCVAKAQKTGVEGNETPVAHPAAQGTEAPAPPSAPLRARLILLREQDGVSVCYDEEITPAAASRFFSRVVGAFFKNAADQIARVRDRLPTLTRLPFPYPAVRESQNELMQAAFRAMRRGTRLYASAPTGIGKTAAVLYPALRALGERTVERVFYLTPKTTTARAAADTLSRFAEAGGSFRALVLAAKERLCRRRLLCRVGDEPCRAAHAGAGREEEALSQLLSMPTVPMTGREIGDVAARFGVCPYELSLRYSLFADVIVCDYNYLFDPRVSLRRYFTAGGDYAILVDEAHDLLDRAREIYSADLARDALSALPSLLRKRKETDALAPLATALFDAFLRTVDAALRDGQNYTDPNGILHGFASSHQPPEELIMATTMLSEELLRAAADHRIPHAERHALRDAARPLADFAAAGDRFSSRFEVFYEREGEARRVRLLCLDPSELIDCALGHGKAAVLFSATLSPLPYYRTVLGGGRSGRELLLDSPFEADNLSVVIMDKLKTRFADREEGKEEVAAALAAMVRAHIGNYFVFCPSYAYMEMLAEAFHTAYPTVSTAVQSRGSTLAERNAFLSRFAEDPKESLLGFAVTGGIYAEGIDLVGTRLVGVAVVGVSLPQPSPERDAMCAYYGELYDAGREYAYIYPGMNRVLQAAGRVIRTETDRGVLLLIDDRFRDPLYRAMIPSHWHRPRLAGNAAAVYRLFSQFWKGE